MSYRRDPYGDNVKYVARITLVKGIPFYGFHVGYKFFLKIYMLNPIVMTRLADLLHQGVIMKRSFQPYEAHFQYLLQFMTDYNLYGCAYLDAAKVFFRAPIPLRLAEGNSQHLWHDHTISADQVTDEYGLPRVSHCSIEVDISVQDIINRNMVKERRLHHDFIERLCPLPDHKKLVHSMAGLWKDETRRRKLNLAKTAPGSSPFPAEALVSMSADPRSMQNQGWIHEDEYRAEVERLIAAEREADTGPQPTFENFVVDDPLGLTVKTALESVEDLHPANLTSALGLLAEPPPLDPNQANTIEVDEQGALKVGGFQLDSILRDSDEELPPELGNQTTAKSSVARKNRVATTYGFERVSRRRRRRKVATHLENTTTRGSVKGLVDHPALAMYTGISMSQFKTGVVPVIPLHDELYSIAEYWGLTSRNTHTVQPSYLDDASLKRSASLPETNHHVKKLRIDTASQPTHLPGSSSKTRSSDPRMVRSQPGPVAIEHRPQHTIRSGPRKLLGVQKRSDSNQTLNFATTKSQDDTISRKVPLTSGLKADRNPADLSAQKAKPVKVLAFDPAVVVIRDKTDSSSVPSDKVALNPEYESRLQQAHMALVAFNGGELKPLGGLPPSEPDVKLSWNTHKSPDIIYQNAYYSDEKDVPLQPREYAGREFRLASKACAYLPEFDPTGTSAATQGLHELGLDDAAIGYQDSMHCSFRSWEIAQPPPSSEEVAAWWSEEEAKATTRRLRRSPTKPLQSPGRRHLVSQIVGPTPKNKHDFKYSQKKTSTSVKHEAQYMSTMSLEIHVNSRGKLVPNPDEDEVQCIFWSIKADGTVSTTQGTVGELIVGVIVLSADGQIAERIRRQTSAEVLEESDELALMVRMVEIVRTHDPDILTGYEVHGSSWGYLIERARLKYDYDLCDEFSRVKTNSHGRIGKDNDRWGFNTTSTIRVTGRHMINVWRAMRGELNLLQYTMENVVWHLLHRRIPHYSWKTLTDWYQGEKQRDFSKLLRYYLARTRLDIEILEANELIPRTSEQARLLGVDFFSVFSRGSQFKVESIMFRIAKPENFMLVSPSRKQVGGQNALECLPLVMEPQSAFYNSPLLVLDFQSLYPSVMIAYNLCYSTFLGRIVNWRGMNKMGFTEYKRHERLLGLVKDHINITPNGMMYVKADIRKSLLAKMLTEILETRVMVKSGMRQDKGDKTLQQLLNNRQLALKLLANVTYGYTSASFSGRMPCSEIADSIVQTGRETLERAIAFIHSQKRWDAEVVYGDTDSLFVYLKGRTRDQAFDIGNEIAKAITDMNPRPIRLKFEKVYHPCVLLAKKRYVGYKYESKDQVIPEFDAKGIETVRRDGTPAEQKIEEKALKLLFETADLSQIKAYFQSQCEKVMRGAVSIQDFCFAKEVKLGSYSDKGAPPPGALISTKRMLEDPRAEPQYGERIPYVVVTGAPGARLIDRCVAPEELLNDPHSQLDAEYYISKNLIPPLERIFNLVGANVRGWYEEMPKYHRIQRLEHEPGEAAAAAAAVVAAAAAAAATGADLNDMKKTLESYMKAASCIVCDVKMDDEGMLCTRCSEDGPASALVLQARLGREWKTYQDVMRICRTCAGVPQLDEVPCDSKDCPVFYTRVKQKTKLQAERSLLEPVINELGAEAARTALEW